LSVALVPLAARNRAENFRLGLDQHRLLRLCQFHHAPGIVGITEGGEDAFADAEIGRALMSAFDRAGESECRAAKMTGRHRALASMPVPVHIAFCGAVCSSSSNCFL